MAQQQMMGAALMGGGIMASTLSSPMQPAMLPIPDQLQV
jgi:hypothetical protein